MTITINGTEYDIGSFLNYAQRNPDGAYQDKLKYRLVEQNNLILNALELISRECQEIREIIDTFVTIFIWAADDDTIIAADDDTILVFYEEGY